MRAIFLRLNPTWCATWLVVALVLSSSARMLSAQQAAISIPTEALPTAQLPAAAQYEPLGPPLTLPASDSMPTTVMQYETTTVLPDLAPDEQPLIPALANVPLCVYGFTVADSWRGVSDGSFQNNNGAKKGLNSGLLLPGLEEFGIGAQLGASFGLYDTTGRASVPNEDWQKQTFITAGFFRRASPDLPIAAGIVYDGMVNDAFGVFATSPFLSQFRGQIGYAVNESDEIGFWMTHHDHGASRTPLGIPVHWLPMNQYNLFWHHKYCSSAADTWFWIGVPQRDRINGQGSLGQLILGSSASVPVNDRLTIYANAAYMMPSARDSVAGSTEDAFYVGFGAAVYTRRNARQGSVRGNPREPYLPVADNSNFFVDSTVTF